MPLQPLSMFTSIIHARGHLSESPWVSDMVGASMLLFTYKEPLFTFKKRLQSTLSVTGGDLLKCSRLV